MRLSSAMASAWHRANRKLYQEAAFRADDRQEIDAERYRTGQPGEAELLKLDKLSASGFKGIGFSLRKGEILGITGLADSGRNELAMAITGVVPAHSGSIRLEGTVTEVKSPAEAIERGIGYVPEDRLAEGLFLDKSIFENEIALIFKSSATALASLIRKRAGLLPPR